MKGADANGGTIAEMTYPAKAQRSGSPQFVLVFSEEWEEVRAEINETPPAPAAGSSILFFSI